MAADSFKPYLAYYQRKYRKTVQGGSLLTDLGIGTAPTYEVADTGRAIQAAAETAVRRNALAATQGLNAAGDLTDTVIQDAAARERRRRQVGRTGASSFLSASQSLIGGGTP